MANKTVNQLTEDTSPTVDDFIPVWDVTSATTKKATLLKLLLKILNGGSDWAWSSWTPTLANITLGNGTQVAKYTQIGKTVRFVWHLTFGSTTVMGTAPTVSLPVTASANVLLLAQDIGQVNILDAGTANYNGSARANTTTSMSIHVYQSDTTFVQQATITATIPMTWTTGDKVSVSGFYEAA